MAKFIVSVSTDIVGSLCEAEVEIPDEELAELSEKDIEQQMLDQMFDMIEWNYIQV